MDLPSKTTLETVPGLLETLKAALATGSGPVRIDASALQAFDTSAIALRIDGRLVASAVAPPDDARGRALELVVDDAAVLRAVFSRAGPHEIALEAEGDHGAGGLCVYGPATAASSPDEATTALELEWSDTAR